MNIPTHQELAHHFDRARAVVLAATGRWITLDALRTDPGGRYPCSWQVEVRTFAGANDRRVFLIAALCKREVIGTSFASGDEITELDQWSELTITGTPDEVSGKFAAWLLPYGFAFRGTNLGGCEPFLAEFAVDDGGAVAIVELGPVRVPPEALHRSRDRHDSARRRAW